MEADEVVDSNLLIEGRGSLTTFFSLLEYPPAAYREVRVLWPERSDYAKALQVMEELRRRGTTLPAIDVLIASMCLNRGLQLATRDRDFESVRAAFPEFKIRFERE